ncbi:MAG: hypothetical protein ACREFY_01040, partial [Acetobacteraceae bacterium]
LAPAPSGQDQDQLEFAIETAYHHGAAAEHKLRVAAEARAAKLELQLRQAEAAADHSDNQRRLAERDREARHRRTLDRRNAELLALRAECNNPKNRQTPQQRRAEVLHLLDDPTLSDRSTARRVGVSPQTVGTLRRGQRPTPSKVESIVPTPSKLDGALGTVARARDAGNCEPAAPIG